MNKLDSSHIHNIIPMELGDRMCKELHLNFSVNYLSCTVCKKRPLDKLDSVFVIIDDHFVYVDNVYYFLPLWHVSCREMFMLNPLVYE